MALPHSPATHSVHSVPLRGVWAIVPGVFVVLSMVMFLVTEIIGSLGFHGTPLPQVVWLRYTCHLLLMLVVFGGPTRLSFLRTARPGLQIFRSLLMLVMPMAYVLAIQTARGSAVFTIFAMSPLLVIGLAYAAGERAPRAGAVLAAVGCVGAFILYHPALLSMGWGVLAALGMALSYSGYIVLTRVLDRTERMLTNLFYSALGVFIALTLAAPFFWKPIGLREIVAGAALATSGWIGLYLLELGLRRDTAARLAPFLLTQTLLDGVFRAIDRGGVPDGAIIVGSSLVAAALAAAFLMVSREPRLHAAVPALQDASDGAT